MVISKKQAQKEGNTKAYDNIATKYLGIIAFPLFLVYCVYSLYTEEYRSWYSFTVRSMAGFIYVAGFLMMTPQLYINYKLQSVAHLPWKVMTYRALNTVIDDLFAMIISMPMMHRVACFRDDVIFVIYMYQRWKYRVDPTRHYMEEGALSAAEEREKTD